MPGEERLNLHIVDSIMDFHPRHSYPQQLGQHRSNGIIRAPSPYQLRYWIRQQVQQSNMDSRHQRRNRHLGIYSLPTS